MAIRVTHARIEDVGKLGLEAGKGEQAVRQEAQQLEADLAAQSNATRLQAASINASTAIQKAVMDAENNREMVEFTSFMRAESERRQIAWQTEKLEMAQRHDFDLNMQRKDLENQMIAEKDMRKQSEKDQKTEALSKARDNFEITDDQYKNAVLSLEVGVSPGRALFGEGGEIGLMQTSTYKSELAKEKTAAEFAKPEAVEQRRVTARRDMGETLLKSASHPLLDTETRQEAQSIIDDPNATVADITRANQVIEAKIQQVTEARRTQTRSGKLDVQAAPGIGAAFRTL